MKLHLTLINFLKNITSNNFIFNRYLSTIIKRLTFILLLIYSQLSFAQPQCSSIQTWSASNRGGSGLYNSGEVVLLPGSNKMYTPCYSSTTCHVTDSWCRTKSSCGATPWGFSTTLLTCSNGTANAGEALATIYQEA